jgi:hypothetical protein
VPNPVPLYARYGPWAQDAACHDQCNAMVMPRLRGPRGSEQMRGIRHAIAICNTCPVREPCRERACTTPDPVAGMIAGGLTPAERDRVRRVRRALA